MSAVFTPLTRGGSEGERLCTSIGVETADILDYGCRISLWRVRLITRICSAKMREKHKQVQVLCCHAFLNLSSIIVAALVFSSILYIIEVATDSQALISSLGMYRHLSFTLNVDVMFTLSEIVNMKLR